VNAVLELERVTKDYPGSPPVRALDGVTLSVSVGELVAVVGPSGSGKTTMLHVMGTLDRASSGTVRVTGLEAARMTDREVSALRAFRIGFVFQQFFLAEHQSVLANVTDGLLYAGIPRAERRRLAAVALERVGLAHRADARPTQLSGGQRQRVAIARAIAGRPPVVLADEPTGNLDAVNEEIVLRLLRELHQQGRTIVMVTHDPVVARLADRRIELHHGRIAAQEVFAMADEEQFDEVLEELWVMAEHGEIAELEHMEVHGALPVSIAVEKMTELGLVAAGPHPPERHVHRPFVNPCHDNLKPLGASTGDGSMIIEMTERGRKRAADVIRRHRLAERLFTDSLAMDSETEIEEQACKFEHILSPGATDKICAFLGHPRTCPHGAPIPPGECCGKNSEYEQLTNKLKGIQSAGPYSRDEMNER